MRRLVVSASVLSLVGAGEVHAKPSAAVVAKASKSVVRVVAINCKRGTRSGITAASSGFAVTVNGESVLVAALHGVAGCDLKNVEVHYASKVYTTSVAKVYRRGDLAMLAMPSDLSIPALAMATELPAPGHDLESLGFGPTPTLNPHHTEVRLGGASAIQGLLQSSQTKKALIKQQYPSITDPIINLDTALSPGDSGAALIDDNGDVVGVANGNLLQGTLPYSWAFPISGVLQLVASKEPDVQDSVIQDVLIAHELVGAAVPTQPSTLACGALNAEYRGTQTFARMVATADPFAASHLAVVQNYATVNNVPIPATAEFDVYVDPSTGADVAIPTGYSISVGGNDCIAHDPSGEIEIRISGEAIASLQQTSPSANAFITRTVAPSEFLFPNPTFTTLPTTRVPDGMVVQRAAQYYGTPPFLAPPREGYTTFAYKNGMLLAQSSRLLTSPASAQAKATAFIAIAAAHATTFTIP